MLSNEASLRVWKDGKMTPPRRPCMLTGRAAEGVPRCVELSTTAAADREIQQLNNYSQLGRKEKETPLQLPWETEYLAKPS